MYKGLVSKRPFKKKTRKKIWLKGMLQKNWLSLPKFSFSLGNRGKKILMRGIVVLILLWCWYRFLFKDFFLKDEFYINNVQFSENTIATYEDLDLLDYITKSLKGKNYYEFQYFLQGNLLQESKEIVPFIDTLSYQLNTGNTIGIDITFKDPLFRVRIWERIFGVRWDQVSSLLLDTMQLGNQTFILETPQYLSWVDSLNGFFHEISVDKMLTVINFVQEEISDFSSLVYFAWSTRFVVNTTNGQEIYFDFQDEEMLEQEFKKYRLLRDYYPEFSSIFAFDLWALDESKVIIRKR